MQWNEVGPQGFEPWTLGLKVRCSAKLSYRPGILMLRRLLDAPYGPTRPLQSVKVAHPNITDMLLKWKASKKAEAPDLRRNRGRVQRLRQSKGQ